MRVPVSPLLSCPSLQAPKPSIAGAKRRVGRPLDGGVRHRRRSSKCRAAPESPAALERSASDSPAASWPRVACLALILIYCSQLTSCAVLAAVTVDGVYAAAFRTTIVDPSRLSADDQEKARAVQVLTTSDTPPHVSKGAVKGFACKLLGLSGWQWRPEPSQTSGSTPEQAALSQMKIKTVQIGGNAVVLGSCSHGDTWDWGNDCFDTWTCIGEAIRIL